MVEQATFLGMNAKGAAIGFTAGSSIGSAIESVFNAYNQQSIANYNAALSRRAAQDALDRGMEEEQKYRKQIRQVIGTQRAGFASQNVDVNTGTAAEIQKQTAGIGEMDAITIRNNAILEAWGYQQQAKMYKMQGKAAMGEGIQRAVGSIVGGISNIALMNYKMG